MKQLKVLMSVLFLWISAISFAATEPVDYVSTFVGTVSKVELSTGNTYPAIAMPWGMNFWTPQTGKNGNGWIYTYGADKIRGLKQTHQPSPWINDYGVFSLLPTVGDPVFNEDERASWFSHKAETAKPYYYKVYLADYDVTAEMAPTERAAMMRFTYKTTDKTNVVIDAYDQGSYVKVIPGERKVIGYSTYNSGRGHVPDNFKNYFVMVFDRDIAAVKMADKDVLTDGHEVSSEHAGVVLTLKLHEKGDAVNVRIASSFISPEQAELNLKELGDNSIEQVAAQGRQRWNDVLGRITVKDDDIDHLRTFYSCYYRSVLFPRCLSEINAEGKVVHYSPYNGKVLPGYMFTDTGFWDTFRCLFPFLNLVYPSMSQKMQQGLANAYRESGFLPEWASPGHVKCMIGNNSASIVADAYMKGIRTKDTELLWEALVHGANAVHPSVSSVGRRGYEYYNSLGYIPHDVNINYSVSRTLEYAYDDWCIYRMGKALGKSNNELIPFKHNAMNYKNVFDKSVGLMRGRLRKGKFQTPFSPYKWGADFIEGNSWHWTWCVFHDPQGLINLMGGNDKFNEKMDSVFSVPPIYDESFYRTVIHEIREMQVMNMGNYAHGNQPIQHMPYLYNYSGEPWKAQYWVREVMDRLYNAHPDGYCGDEDNGQTSAWYVFSALGFYPVCPGSNEYVLGTPYFKHVDVRLENGKTLTIDAENNNADNRYIQQMTVNGKPSTQNYLTHKTLTSGGKIHYVMGNQPNKKRGVKPSDAPYSFTGK